MTDIEKALAEALRKPMMANGLDSTANQGYHGWRCEHVDRYGPCDCFDELVRDLAVDVAATPQMQVIARQAAIGATVERYKDAVMNCIAACRDDGREPKRYRDWYAEAYEALTAALGDNDD